MKEKIYNYRPARYLAGRNNSYVVYSVLNPESGKLVYRRIKLNYIQLKSERKKYAEELIKTINAKLSSGYNPFLENTKAAKLILLSDAIKEFLKFKRREVEVHNICADTYTHYLQHLTTFQQQLSNIYVYKIKESTVNSFLDALYIQQQVTAVTRNNYLQTLKIFFAFCIKRDYITENPTQNIKNMKAAPKRRQAIPAKDLQRIFKYLRETDKHYLLACYLLYACFIRPSEICKLRISAISFQKQTIYIDASISKNKKSQTVTIPKNLLLYMLDLRIYDAPGNYYIVGHDFTPSLNPCSDKILRARWLKVRKELNMPAEYQFYSLKDTGITQMITMLNVTDVRDQARHHSIAITDVYTDRAKMDGNSHIKNMNFTPNNAV